MSVDDVRRAVVAGLIVCGASTGAAAWQRPKAQAPSKVGACPEMGEGFVRIPGSGTCISVGGSVRVEALHVGGAAGYYPTGR